MRARREARRRLAHRHARSQRRRLSLRRVYREIVAPERLVFTSIAFDNAGNHLLEGVTTVIFAEENGKTKITLTARAKGLVPQAPYMLEGMEAGWSQSLDKLAASLASGFLESSGS